MPYAVSDLPDEWRSTPVTRGAHARFGTFKRLVGQNMPDIFDFTHWLGSSTSGDSGAATDEVAGTGWTVTEYIKALIWQLRKLHSDYKEHKLQQHDLALKNAAHAAATLQSFTQVRGILDALKAEQHRMEESLRLYQLAYSGRLDEIATSHINLQNQFRGERLRNERVEHVELVQVRADVSETWKRVEHEGTRGDNYHYRLEQLEAGTAPSNLASFADIIRHRISNLDHQVSGLLFPDGVPQPEPGSPASD